MSMGTTLTPFATGEGEDPAVVVINGRRIASGDEVELAGGLTVQVTPTGYVLDPSGSAAVLGYGESLTVSFTVQIGEPLPQVPLADLTGTTGFVINGGAPLDNSGVSVAGAGDVNGDGIDDVIVGAFNATDSAGAAFVVFGTRAGFGQGVDLGALTGANGFVLRGVDEGDATGIAVAGAGDLNGDGLADLIIGAERADPSGRVEAGRTFVVFGRQNGFGPSLDLAFLDGTTGFVINGLSPGDLTGAAVSAAGDLNGDGFDDLVLGASRADPGGRQNAGATYVIFGSQAGFGASLDLTGLTGANGFVINGVGAGDYSGGAVAAAGDLNGDGIDDLIIGASRADPNGRADAGAAYVVFGSRTTFAPNLELSSLTGANGFVLAGIDPRDGNGTAVAGVSDVNGDGLDDIIIGAPSAAPGGRAFAGESYVVFGRLDGFGPTLDLSTLTETTGVVITGVDTLDASGAVVSGAGDLNGDGLADFLVGAKLANAGGRSGAGETYVVFGSRTGFGPTIALSTLDGTDGFVINGVDVYDNSGVSAAAAGDVNGDGFDDLIIGANGADPSGRQSAGESYILFGGPGIAATLSGPQTVETVVFGPTLLLGTEGPDTLDGGPMADEIRGLGAGDRLRGLDGNDTLQGGEGDDTLEGGSGNDLLEGGPGTDVAVYAVGPQGLQIRDLGEGRFSVTVEGLGTDTLVGIDRLQTLDGDVEMTPEMDGLFRTTANGQSWMFPGSTYQGPVPYLQRQALGIDGNEVMGGTRFNDFFNLLGGDDAADAGPGDDVLDGGFGSNFLTGGSGRDVFFLDGRGGGVVWSTITDWGPGEQLSIWGWRPGISQARWVDSDGAPGFQGVTLHADLDGNGITDTSVTFSGKTQADLPQPLEFTDPALLWFIG